MSGSPVWFCEICKKHVTGYIEDHVCVIGGEIMIRDVIKKWRILADSQTYSMYAAIYTECADDIEKIESETEQKLKEAVELLTSVENAVIGNEIKAFLSTIKDKS
jgi:predicted DNA binding protein